MRGIRGWNRPRRGPRGTDKEDRDSRVRPRSRILSPRKKQDRGKRRRWREEEEEEEVKEERGEERGEGLV